MALLGEHEDLDLDAQHLHNSQAWLQTAQIEHLAKMMVFRVWGLGSQGQRWVLPQPSGENLALGLSMAEALPLLSSTGTDMAVFCLLCGKRFQAQSALQQHMEVHAGVRSYICSECNRTFPSHTALKRHLRSHTGRLVQGMGGERLWTFSLGFKR